MDKNTSFWVSVIVGFIVPWLQALFFVGLGYYAVFYLIIDGIQKGNLSLKTVAISLPLLLPLCYGV